MSRFFNEIAFSSEDVGSPESLNSWQLIPGSMPDYMDKPRHNGQHSVDQQGLMLSRDYIFGMVT
jgi:hypothetical protein